MKNKETETIRRLREDGLDDIAIASELESWRNDSDNNWEWDSWFASNFPRLAAKYDVGQHGNSIEPKKRPTVTKKPTKRDNKDTPSVTSGNVVEKTTIETLEFVKTSAGFDRDRQFDVYCFADYRGDKKDTSGGIALVLGIPENPIIHVCDVVSRGSLAKFWLNLLRTLNQTDARLIFGQDHQYGVPKGLLDELNLSGPWRDVMKAIFCGQRFGDHAKNGNAGSFAAEFNRVLVDSGKEEYFYSSTKSEYYGIPKTTPRPSNPHEYRITEKQCGQNPFPFARIGDNGSVGGQTIVGIPNILDLLDSEVGHSVFVWPFDGADLSEDCRNVLVEVYPTSMRSKDIPQSDLNDAIACVEWCMRKDSNGSLGELLSSKAFQDLGVDLSTVTLEGWYLK